MPNRKILFHFIHAFVIPPYNTFAPSIYLKPKVMFPPFRSIYPPLILASIKIPLTKHYKPQSVGRNYTAKSASTHGLRRWQFRSRGIFFNKSRSQVIRTVIRNITVTTWRARADRLP